MAEITTGNTVVLKKYGNRRLYDTSTSRYVTLHDLEEMVQRGIDVQVVDAKSGDDLTKEVLVQIILDKDGAREMLPTGFLKQVVQLSSSPLKEKFTRTVQDALDGFLGTQRALVDAQRTMLSQMQQMPLQAAWNPFAAFAGPPPAQAQAPAQAAQNGEVERLRAEVSETQALLRQLIQQQAQQQQPAPARAKRRR